MTAVLFVLILALLILAHELGHFLVAKMTKIPVEEFAIGFPPRLFAKRKNGTLYSVNLIPLGGYVKLKGETGDSKDHNSFANKPVTQRLLVIVAGVVMNALLAVILLTIGFKIGMAPLLGDSQNYKGVKTSEVYITGTLKGSAAEKEGLKAGDKIISLQGQKIQSVKSLQKLAQKNSRQEVELVVENNRKQKKLRLKLGEGNSPIGVYLIETTKVKLGLLDAVKAGFNETMLSIAMITNFIGKFFSQLFTSGSVPGEGTGPVGIYSLIGQAAKMGTVFVIQLTAVLSINLAVINIIPFPALDGGRALFIILEGIFRKKVIKSQVEGVIHTIGFIILVLLLLAITVRDIIRL